MRFFSQPFIVAEQFTGKKGIYVPIKDTPRSFDDIIEGRADNLPEQASLYVGSIDDVRARVAEMGSEPETAGRRAKRSYLT